MKKDRLTLFINDLRLSVSNKACHTRKQFKLYFDIEEAKEIIEQCESLISELETMEKIINALRIIKNSKDVDGEFVKIVDENFWDLLS